MNEFFVIIEISWNGTSPQPFVVNSTDKLTKNQTVVFKGTQKECRLKCIEITKNQKLTPIERFITGK